MGLYPGVRFEGTEAFAFGSIVALDRGMQFMEQARFCAKCGSEAIEVTARKRLHCNACGFHFYINTASAVAGYLLDGQDRVLLVRRARDPAKGKLSPPGGFLDFEETGEEAVIREIREETGLEVAVTGYLGSFPNHYHYRGTDYPTLDVFFLCRTDSFDGAEALEEVESIVIRPWRSIDPKEIAFESMRRAYSVLSRRLSGR